MGIRLTHPAERVSFRLPMTENRPRMIVAAFALTAVALAGIGVPLHGHAPDHDEDVPHIESSHHTHLVSYAQDDERRATPGAKIVLAPPATPPQRAIPAAATIESFAVDLPCPGGRHPPSRPTRAPPA